MGIFPDDKPDALPFFLPMFHIFGLIVVLNALSNGKTLVIMDKFNLAQYLQLIEQHKVSLYNRAVNNVDFTLYKI